MSYRYTLKLYIGYLGLFHGDKRVYLNVRFQVLTAASRQFRVFWDIMLCSHVEVDRRFRDAYCLHHQVPMMKAVRTSETSVSFNVTTRRYIPEDSKLHRLCLKHIYKFCNVATVCKPTDKEIVLVRIFEVMSDKCNVPDFCASAISSFRC
jgi:hypothetical protein